MAGAHVTPVFEQSHHIFAALTVGGDGRMNVVWLDLSSPAEAAKQWQGPVAFGDNRLVPGGFVSEVFEQSPRIWAALTVDKGGQINVVWLDLSSPAQAAKQWQGPVAFGDAGLSPGGFVTKPYRAI
jgi:hypothetical protein